MIFLLFADHVYRSWLMVCNGAPVLKQLTIALAIGAFGCQPRRLVHVTIALWRLFFFLTNRAPFGRLYEASDH